MIPKKKSRKNSRQLVDDGMVHDLLRLEELSEFRQFARWCEWRVVQSNQGEILHIMKHGREERLFYDGGEYVYFRRGLFPLVFTYTSGIAAELFAELNGINAGSQAAI